MKTLVTHDGTFHADDVFAFAVLRAAIGPDLVLHRTRDPEVIWTADVVFDVGGTFDPATSRFDHHMRGNAPVRDNGVPYSSFGLVWKHFGMDCLRSREPRRDEEMLQRVWLALDAGLVLQVDKTDNGFEAGRPGDLGDLVEAFNPPWHSEIDRDARFLEAAAFADGVLGREIAAIVSREHARVVVVEELARRRDDPRILELGAGMPWEDVVCGGNYPELLYVVFPEGERGNWMCKAVPTEPGALAQRHPLPAEWRGLRDAVLADLTGIPDAVFCHLGGFICGAGSREGALALARAAIHRPTSDPAIERGRHVR